MLVTRAATIDDLPALTAIYNHYIIHTPITFDVRPLEPHERRGWFDDHPGGRYRLLVAEEAGKVVAYATSSRWRPKAAYDTTIETSIYCHPQATGRGVGKRLYEALFAATAGQDVHQAVAGITMPNAASVALHRRFGFTQVGEFAEVGRSSIGTGTSRGSSDGSLGRASRE